MKKILLSFVLLICVGLFAGCTTVSSSSYVNTDITSIYITMSYDEENLVDIGIDAESELLLVRQDIESKASSYMEQLLEKYKNIINALNANGILTDNEKILYKNHLSMYSGWDDETYIVELRFYTTTASRIFIKYGGDAESAEITTSLFTTKVSEEYSNIFTDTPDNLIANSVNDYFSDSVSAVISANFGETAENGFYGINVNYLFLTTNSRMHSNGTIVETTEGSLHCFIDSDEGNTFNFYRIDANRYIWYLFALTVTMIFVAISLVVAYFMNGNKKEIAKSIDLKNKL